MNVRSEAQEENMRVLACAIAIGTALIMASPCCAQAWTKYQPSNLGYSIDMPAEWTVTERKTSPRPGNDYILHAATARADNRTYLVVQMPVPPEKLQGVSAAAVLDGIRNGALAKVKGTLRSETHINIGEFSGREIIVDGPNSNVFVARLVLMNNAVVQAIVAGPQGVERESSTRRFLSSLEPLNEASKDSKPPLLTSPPRQIPRRDRQESL
jgi:hypothetical protein